jgi:TP901 family phage tail tape measure protein
LKIFKDAAAESENLSEAIQKLTSKQSSLSQEINALETTKTTLKNKLTEDGTGLNKTGLKEFTEKNEDAKKVLLSDGTKATHEQILEIQEAVNKYLASTGKTLAQLKQADIEAINQEYKTNIKDRNSAFASIRYERAFSQEPGKIASEIEKTDEKIASKTEELEAVKTQLENVNTAAQNGADAINKLYIEINNLADATNKAITSEINKQSEKNVDKTPAAVSTGGGGDPVKPVKEQVSGLGKAFKQFTIYQVALRGIKVALREAVTTVKELDKELTEQAMVTGLTRDQTYKLVGAYQDLAIQTGATTKEIAGVATEYIKQGKSIKDALTLTEAAVAAAKVAGVSTADSVNYLTTALNGFQLAASDAMLVSDKFAAVAAASATDYDELAIALSKVASQANLAGMSIDYTTALLTKGLETTREAPETMGTALKTIIARMRELGDYGETLEGDTDINNVESQLAYVGIALRNTEGELRSTEDVLDELGKKWDTLDKNQQAAVAKALAGTRQQSRLIAMMSDYERVTELQQISMRSAGTTAAQADVYLQGIEASLNKVQVA